MKMIVEFVYGGAPWPARGTGDKDNSQIFGEDGKVSMQENVKSRRWEAFAELRQHWEEAGNVWNDLLTMRL
jgi:hypothetical protein